MIKLEIPEDNQRILVAAARFLMECAGHQLAAAPNSEIPKPRVDVSPQLLNPYMPPYGNCGVSGAMEQDTEIKKPKKIRKPKTIAEEVVNVVVESAVDIDTKVGMEVMAQMEAPPPPTMNFGDLITKITRLVGAAKLTQGQILEVIGKYGLARVADITSNESLVPKINSDIDTLVGV